jgi:RNA polymerase sigma factor (sigma-70 family)
MLPSFPSLLAVASASRNSNEHDRVLWGNFREGSREALGTLYKRHISGMYRHGLFFCNDPDLVQDCMQELFSRLWSRRNRISDADCVQAYLYRSLKRILVVQLLRNRSRIVPLDDAAEQCDFSASVEDSTIEREFRKLQVARIRLGLRSLTRNQREAVVLRYFNGLTYIQISEVMELRVDSVYNLMSKAIEQLRTELEIAA